MKLFLQLLFVSILATILFGFYVKEDPNYNSDAIIGVGVLLFSFILMPFFIYYRWKDKKVADYMLTKENIEKMQKDD